MMWLYVGSSHVSSNKPLAVVVQCAALFCGVLQGSILGLLSFTVYTRRALTPHEITASSSLCFFKQTRFLVVWISQDVGNIIAADSCCQPAVLPPQPTDVLLDPHLATGELTEVP